MFLAYRLCVNDLLPQLAPQTEPLIPVAWGRGDGNAVGRWAVATRRTGATVSCGGAAV